MDFDPSQLEALDRIEEWYQTDPDSNVFKEVGAAGTGKTTLIKPLVERLGLNIESDRETEGGCRIMAYTNRAARVLNSKGLRARTIHGFAGHPPPELPDDPEVRAEYKRLRDKLVETQSASVQFQKAAQKALDAFLLKYRNREEELEFKLDPHSILEQTNLVVADEMSMLDEEMGRIIEDQCSKLLILGDPLQLGPPTKEGSYFFPEGGVYDHELTTIHRQDAGKLADFLMGLRERRDVQFAQYAGSRYEPDVHIYRGIPPHREALRMADLAIARTHDRVFELNMAMREAKGLAGQGRPHPGERLLMQYQNIQRRAFKNDFVWFKEQPEYDVDQKLLRGVVESDGGVIGDPAIVNEGVEPKQLVLPEYFTVPPGPRGKIEWRKMEASARFEDRWSGVLKMAFGHAVTDFQSQGSEFDTVLVWFKPFWSRNATPAERATMEEQNFRSLYTACSRARKRLFLYFS